MPTTSYRIGVALLAAGASSRMGRPKMLLPWGNTSILGHHVETWRRLGAAQIAVVYSRTDPRVSQELDRLNFGSNDRILNTAPEQGMFSSIRAAAEWSGWTPEVAHWALVLGDQPHVGRETLAALLEFAAANGERICQPTRQGRPRHPVILPNFYFRQLASSDATNLKDFLAEHTTARSFLEMNDPALDLDLDTPSDYDTAVKLYLRENNDESNEPRNGRQ